MSGALRVHHFHVWYTITLGQCAGAAEGCQSGQVGLFRGGFSFIGSTGLKRHNVPAIHATVSLNYLVKLVSSTVGRRTAFIQQCVIVCRLLTLLVLRKLNAELVTGFFSNKVKASHGPDSPPGKRSAINERLKSPKRRESL